MKKTIPSLSLTLALLFTAILGLGSIPPVQAHAAAANNDTLYTRAEGDGTVSFKLVSAEKQAVAEGEVKTTRKGRKFTLRDIDGSTTELSATADRERRTVISVKSGNKVSETYTFDQGELENLYDVIKAGRAVESDYGAMQTREKLLGVNSALRRALNLKSAQRVMSTIDRSSIMRDPKSNAAEQDGAVNFIRAVSKPAAANVAAAGSCLDWAMLDYDMCMIEFESSGLCFFSALLMFLSC